MASKRSGLVVLFVFLTFTAFYAESFVFTHLEHEHDHDGTGGSCSLCFEIELVLMLLEGFERIACIALIASLAAYGKKLVLPPIPVYAAAITPVTLKVRLNS
jgi:hypothetical protein